MTTSQRASLCAVALAAAVALGADATPGEIVVEWQRETESAPAQQVLEGSWYALGQGGP